MSLIYSHCTGKANRLDKLDPEKDGGGVTGSSSADSIGILGDFKETFLFYLSLEVWSSNVCIDVAVVLSIIWRSPQNLLATLSRSRYDPSLASS